MWFDVDFRNILKYFLKQKNVGIGELKGVLLEASKKSLSPP